MHNIPDIKDIQPNTSVFNNGSTTVAFLGGIGYYKQNVALVNSVKNNQGIKVIYRGRYPKEYNIRDYCYDEKISNVEFYGAFNNSEKKSLYSDVDFINAIYGNDSLIVTTALPNKLYDCLFYKIPILVSNGTYLGEIVQEYGLGVLVDSNCEQLVQKIHEYRDNFNRDVFVKNCNSLLGVIFEEQQQTDEVLLEFLRGLDK